MGTKISAGELRKCEINDKNDMGARVLRGVVVAVVSAVVSTAVVLGNMSPFGIAAVVAVDPMSAVFAAAGCVIGYTLTMELAVAIKYIAAAALVLGLRRMCSMFGIFSESRVFLPVASGVCLLIVGIATGYFGGLSLYEGIIALADAGLLVGSSYFFSSALDAFYKKKNLTTLSTGELCSILVIISVVMMALSRADLFGVNIGRIASVTVILLAAYSGRESFGSITGTVLGISISLATDSPPLIAGAYALGGLLSGLFMPLGRIAAALVFLMSATVMLLISGASRELLSIVYETAVAGLLFTLLPKSLSVTARPQTADEPLPDNDIRRHLKMRIKYIAATFEEVSRSVKAVTERLSNLSGNDLSDVYSSATDRVCRHCQMRMFCFDDVYGETMDALSSLGGQLKRNGEITPDDLPKFFSQRCQKCHKLCDEINKEYNEHLICVAAGRRMNEVRGLLADQYHGVSQVFSDLIEYIDTIDRTDLKTEKRARDVLIDSGIEVTDVCSLVDIYGKTSVEIDCVGANDDDLKDVTDTLSSLCNTEFDKASMVRIGDRARITLFEKAAYSINVGVAQSVCTGETHCGDSFDRFTDDKGYAYMILSDGMGSGSRAAVDGAMATGLLARFLKAGLSFDCAVFMVNATLIGKSDDETLTTADVTCFDMYTGRATLSKAGAAPTFIRKSGRPLKIECDSLPLGILKNIAFEKNTVSLSKGDIILMVSDGAVASGEEWIMNELEDFRGDDPDELAKRILTLAKRRRNDGHDDDITVMVAIIEKGI